MKTQKIRHSVFETNSSSTHSICIAKNATLTIPKELHFTFGEFGWEHHSLSSVHSKASYLYTALFHNEREEDANKILKILKNDGIKVTAETPAYHKNDMKYYFSSGYVDHGGDLTDFLDEICSDKEKLMNYLFSDLSFITTGNDNDCHDVSINVDYPHDEYYKGN